MESFNDSCECFELALERRAARGLSESETRDLTAHLAGCAACRAYARAMERMGTMIQTGNAVAETTRPFGRLHEYVQARERRARRLRLINLPLGIATSGLILLISLSEGTTWLALFAIGMLVSSVVNLALILHRQRRYRAAANSDLDLLALAQKEADTRVYSVLSGAALSIVFGALWLIWESFPFRVPLALCFFAYAGYLLLVLLPRARHQRKELE